MVTQKFNVHTLDVWGNGIDGFEVNDVYPSSGSIELSAEAGGPEIFKALMDGGWLEPQRTLEEVEFDLDNGGPLYVNAAADGKPVFELRLAD
jgi:hypothetical protein